MAVLAPSPAVTVGLGVAFALLPALLAARHRARWLAAPPLVRPEFVLFGDSITQQSFAPGGWGAAIANVYQRSALDSLDSAIFLGCCARQ